MLDALNVVDFATVLQRAARWALGGEPPFDHVLVDDYHDTTLAAEAILRGLRAPDLVVAANPHGHVFSFQGTSRAPLERFVDVFETSAPVELATNHRAPEPVTVEAWVAPHASEEHAAIARELRRLHVEHGVGWNDMAVVVRRQGANLGGLLRALDDARIPRAMPERGLVARRRARDQAVRARAAVARGRRGRARVPRRAAPGLRRGGALPGRGPWPAARGSCDDGLDRRTRST